MVIKSIVIVNMTVLPSKSNVFLVVDGGGRRSPAVACWAFYMYVLYDKALVNMLIIIHPFVLYSYSL